MYKKRTKIRKVIQSIREGQMLTAALKVGGVKSTSTWWRWEKEKPRLKNLRVAAQEISGTPRVEQAENALMTCAVGGSLVGLKRTFYENGQVKTEQEFYSTPNPVALIFFLTNRAADRWKDKRAIINNTNINSVKTGEPAGERQFANEHDKAIAEEMRGWLRDHSAKSGRTQVNPAKKSTSRSIS